MVSKRYAVVNDYKVGQWLIKDLTNNEVEAIAYSRSNAEYIADYLNTRS